MNKSTIETLLEVIEFIPEIHKRGRQFDNFQEFIEHNEFGLALESLIELADESGFFSEAFWINLGNCALNMGMLSHADYCCQQIKKRAVVSDGAKQPNIERSI